MKPNNRYRLIYSVFTGKFSILMDTETKTTELNQADLNVLYVMSYLRDMATNSPGNIPEQHRENLVLWSELVTDQIRFHYYPDEYPEPTYKAQQEAVK